MRVRMQRARVLQDAGKELPLDLGQVYDLAPAVALSLIATGAAEVVAETAAVVAAPETKPMRAPETKGRR
jgi:hypothetical protein